MTKNLTKMLYRTCFSLTLTAVISISALASNASAYSYSLILTGTDLVNQGRVALRKGRLDDVLLIYGYALERNLSDRDRMRVHGDLCAVYYLKRSYETALSHCDKAIQLAPNEWVNYNTRANALLEFGRFEDAVADYEKALELSPEPSVVLNNIAIARARAEGEGVEISPLMSTNYPATHDDNLMPLVSDEIASGIQ